MELLDRKLKGHVGQYGLQCLLATASVLAVLIILDAIANAAIIASLGASTFIVFALPRSAQSRARVVVGGYLIGATVGTACHGLGQIQVTDHLVAGKYIAIALAATSVGLSIFLMTITNTEHPPAAGAALGLVIQQWSCQAVLVVVVGAVVLCLAKRGLRSWLKDLT
jgi:CBS-domain-containing membrane protein